MQKEYLYKVYRNGAFLGCLPKVKSTFGFTQNVNAAGPNQITVVLGQSADVSRLAPDPILDEAGEEVLDEAGHIVYPERAAEVVGNSNSKILARNGNQVKIFEYSDRYPNGKCMYNGRIKNWKGVWGDDGDITLVIYPDAAELDNNPLVGSPYTADQSQTSSDSTVSIYQVIGTTWGYYMAGQTFQTGSGQTNIAAIDLKLGGAGDTGLTHTVLVSLHSSASEATILGQASRVITGDGSAHVYKFVFPSPIEISASTTYFFSVRIGGSSGGSAILAYKASNVYANGVNYDRYNTGGKGGTVRDWTTPPNSSVGMSTGDLYFVTYNSGGETTAVFTDADPTADMIKTAMDNYISSGGNITYDDADIEATGEAVDYTFIGATVFAGIQKALQMCPAGYYWTVDPGTNKLSVKNMSDTADIVITKGKDINVLELSASIENVKNDIPFSGGLVSGSNLYKRYTNQESINEWGRGYDPQSDNRVTIADTMDQLGTTRLAIEKDEQYQTSVTLLDAKTDITLCKPGMTIGFAGFGPTVDALVLMIVSLEYTPDTAKLGLGSLPPRTVVTLDQINRELDALQTVDNPDAPS